VAVEIVESCITCGACVWECPTEAIAPGNPRPVVDPEWCTECFGFFAESQCTVVCPVGAIHPVPEDEGVLADRFRRLRPSSALHDTWVWERRRPGGRDRARAMAIE
jgi:ferredoxin